MSRSRLVCNVKHLSLGHEGLIHISDVSKCKVMHFGAKNKKYSYTMQDGGLRKPLETTLEKGLGIWMNCLLKPQDHIAKILSKANQILGLIRRTFICMDGTLMKQLYTSMVRPHLEYGNVVWYPHLRKDIDMIESVQH